MVSYENLQQFPISNSAFLSLSAFHFDHPCGPRLTERARLPGYSSTEYSYLAACPATPGIRPDYTPRSTECTQPLPFQR